MWRKAFVFLVILYLPGCKREESISPCILDELGNSSFLGNVYTCRDTSSRAFIYAARALITLQDSFLIVSINSLIDTINWSFNDTATYKCLLDEGDVTHRLFRKSDGLFSGSLKQKNKLYYNLTDEPCTDSYFGGQIE